MFLKSNDNMCAFTGIDTAQQFKDLLNLLTPLTSKMKYWTGDSRPGRTTIKHHTVKFLVANAPNELISYRSPVWGGRVSDREVTLSDGFLDNILPNDLVLADRCFNIKDSVLQRHACHA